MVVSPRLAATSASEVALLVVLLLLGNNVDDLVGHAEVFDLSKGGKESVSLARSKIFALSS